MDKLSLYEYSSLPLGSIRLLCKDDGAGSSSWSLTQHVLSDAPTFFALSYVWGTEKPTERFDIGQSVLKLTPSLSIVLHELEARRDVRFIWIDQICINQQDELEKVMQVRMMRDIYVSAHKVLVWLGPSTKGSDLAMDSIVPLDEAIGVLPRNRFAYESINLHLPYRDDAFWPALVDLYTRPWYHRVWVLQEAILAKDIEVLCGNRSMPWAAFASFATKMDKLLPSALVQAFEAQWHGCSDNSAQAKLLGFMSIHDIDNMRSCEAKGSKPPFWTYLCMGQRSKVTNPLDCVYGLLGLLASEVLIRSIDVRYDWEPWQGYLHFCKIYIEHDPHLALLSMARCVSKPRELPSWCPNFDSPITVFSLYCNYCFSAGFKPGGPRYSHIKTSAISNIIMVPGFRMDRVKAITKAANPIGDSSITSWEGPNGRAVKVQQYLFECVELFKEVYPAVTTDLQAFSRSLVAGHLREHLPLPAIDSHAVYLQLLDWLFAMASGGAKPRISTKDFLVMKAWLVALNLQSSRRYFITEAGRVGIGHRSVEKGDHVCVFYSARPLFLLRYVDADASAELVGDAYVDGLMDLENMPSGTRGEDEVFAIC